MSFAKCCHYLEIQMLEPTSNDPQDPALQNRGNKFTDGFEHVINAVNSAPIQSDPYPHLYVNGVFQIKLYDDILGHLPDIKAFHKLVDTGWVGKDYSPHRFIFGPGTSQQKPVPKEQWLFWQDFNEAIHLPGFNLYQRRYGKTWTDL